MRTLHVPVLLAGVLRRDFTSCCGSANRSSWTAGVTSGVGGEATLQDDPSSPLTLTAEI